MPGVALRQARRRNRGHRPLPPLPPGRPGVGERQADVVEDGLARQEVEALEHEADAPGAHPGELRVRERRDVLALQQVGPRVRAVEQTEHVHKGGLARARGPHDRHELAGHDREVHAAQRPDGAGGARVGARQAACLDGRDGPRRGEVRRGGRAARARHLTRLPSLPT